MDDFYKKDVERYIRSKDVCKYLSWQPYNAEGKIEEYFRYAKKANRYPDEILIIFYKGIFVGTLHILKKTEGVAQMGFGLLPTFWGRGLGSDCCLELIKYIHMTEWKDNIIKLITVIHKENTAAIKIASKNFFTKDINQVGVKTNYIRYILYI